MQAGRKSSFLSVVFVASCVLLAAALNPAHAQGAGEGGNATPTAGEVLSLAGWFSIVWGDSRDGETSVVYSMTGPEGEETLLHIDREVARRLGGLLRFNGKYVTVVGTLMTPVDPVAVRLQAEEVAQTLLNVISVSLAEPPESKAPSAMGVTALAAVSGSHPWVTIMCQFSDIAAQPRDWNYFDGMYTDTHPGLNHYWRELSFDTVNIDGSAVAGSGWYTIDTLATYNPGLCADCTGGAGRSALFDACTAAADADVDFTQFTGINLMFNADFDFGWAWGGSRTTTLDGETRKWSVTWEPPWAYANVSVIAHEMGHGFGLPHSSFDRSVVYDSPWDVMSQDRYNCAAATDPTYGCMAQHTISHHKDLLEWIPAARKRTIADGTHATITLLDLALPAASHYQMATLPIGGSATRFYTVEARRFSGYDGKLPDQGIVIHDVDTTEDIPAVLVPDGGTAHPWRVGRTFIDAANGVAVIVSADTGGGFVVTLSNGNLPPASDAGGPYEVECAGLTTSVALDGGGSSDPEGLPLTYAWTTDCPQGVFDDPASAAPLLTLRTLSTCVVGCNVSLTVTDHGGLSDTDSASVTVRDTTAPVLNDVPGDQTVECDAVPPPAPVTATDMCDADVQPDFAEERVDGSCAGNYTLIRNWEGTDGCGNSTSAWQTVTVEDTQGPIVSCNAPASMAPPQVPASFTATATDNCSGAATQILGYTCQGKRSREASCVVTVEGDTLTIHDSGGVGNTIGWTVESVDGCGNTTEKACSIQVVNPGKNK